MKLLTKSSAPDARLGIVERSAPIWPLRKFCVSDFRQKQEYHM